MVQRGRSCTFHGCKRRDETNQGCTCTLHHLGQLAYAVVVCLCKSPHRREGWSKAPTTWDDLHGTSSVWNGQTHALLLQERMTICVAHQALLPHFWRRQNRPTMPRDCGLEKILVPPGILDEPTSVHVDGWRLCRLQSRDPRLEFLQSRLGRPGETS